MAVSVPTTPRGRRAFVLSGIPLPPGASSATYELYLEPIDALYTGQAAVGPYGMSQVVPSGAMQTISLGTLSAGASVTENFVLPDSADGTATDDGRETQPNAAPGKRRVGWPSWRAMGIRAGFSSTHAPTASSRVEAAALDTTGLPSEGKSAMMIGLWNAADATGTLPDYATTVPFNGAMVGLTTLSGETDEDQEGARRIR